MRAEQLGMAQADGARRGSAKVVEMQLVDAVALHVAGQAMQVLASVQIAVA